MNDLSPRSRIDPATIQTLLDAGIHFEFQFDSPCGGGNYADLGTVTEVMHLLKHGEEHCAAEYFGFADIATYRAWLASDGMALCGGTTNQGLPCRMSVSRHWPLEADEWRELHRIGRCTYHRSERRRNA